MTDRILLINYDFPPTLSGVRRIIKMMRYLPDYGFEPYILSAAPDMRAPLDYEALQEVEQQRCQVWRTPNLTLENALRSVSSRLIAPLRMIHKKLDMATSAPPPKPRTVTRSSITSKAAGFSRRLLAVPDDRFPWLATAIPTAEHILKSHAIRYVLTSSYPNSTHLIGLHLKRKFNIHWHADFRDGWTQNPYFADYITPVHRRFNHRLERLVVQNADTITAISSPIAEHLATLSDYDNVFTLPNGFDLTDLDNLPELPASDKFRMVYTGTMFMQRSPDSFFAAVRGLLNSYPGLEDNIEIIFRSNFKADHSAMIHDLNLESVVQNWGLGTWKESLALQKSADCLLVLEGENPNGHIMLTQKIFEYIATGKPILAVAPEGALTELVRHTRTGIVVHPENVFRIKETLFELFLGRIQMDRNEELIQSFTRQRQAEELASILKGPVTDGWR